MKKNRMMKILIASITVFIISFIATGNFSVKAAEISGTCGESVTYVLSDDGELLTISGTGNMDPDFVDSNFKEKMIRHLLFTRMKKLLELRKWLSQRGLPALVITFLKIVYPLNRLNCHRLLIQLDIVVLEVALV